MLYQLNTNERTMMKYYLGRWFQQELMMFLKILWAADSSSFQPKNSSLNPYSKRNGVEVLTG